MQGIFQKENTDKSLKYGIYRHLPTYEKIIRNLVSFYTKNIWSRQFLLIFIAFNVLASSIGSVLGYKWDDILLVNVENVSNVTKLILIIFYIVIFKNTELPNSFFIRFASKNEALLDRRN